ncbi:MAG TPA: HEAT repeat domain-containing protein [Burkholderiales bacterium]|nr:HEAT repeat domain-containing protein [Burkholderiales bacterium]
MGVAIVGITLLLLVQTILLRMQLIMRQRREQRLAELWQPLFAQSMTALPQSLPPIGKSDWDSFLKLWNSTQESLTGEAKHKLNQLAWACGVNHVAQRLLSQKSMRARLMAVITLGHLQEKNAWARLKSIANDPHPLLSLAAARALVQIDAKAALVDLLPLFTSRHDWPLNKIASMISEAGADAVTGPLTQAVETAAPEDFPRLVRLLNVAHSEQALPAIRRILQSATDDRVISSCLQALTDPEDVGLARTYTRHPSWFVRVQAVSAVGRIGSREDRDALIAPLSDSVWWVRYRAAQALAGLPQVTLDEVRQIRDKIGDRFAKDILTQVIAEKQTP